VSEPVTALDATFLELEQANTAMHMHIGAALVFPALPEGGVPTIEDVCDRLAGRLGQLPRFSQKLSEPNVGGLRWPSWETDPALDLRRHIRREALPAPGGRDELLAWGAEFWSRQLLRDRPLWELVLLEGLEDGRWALVTKTHHSIADGIGAVNTVNVLLDMGPDASASAGAAPVDIEESGRLLSMVQNSALLAAARGLTGAMASAVRAGIDVASNPSQLSGLLDRAKGVVEHIVQDQLEAAPQTSLSVPIGTTRRLALIESSLDDLKAIKRELGGTVNDVALAAITGGLVRLFEHRGEQPPEAGLRAMVPVNIRVAGDDVAQGNQISSLFVRLPVGTSDPLERYRRIVTETATRKAGKGSLGIATLMDLTALAPPVVHSVLAQALYGTRLFNLGVTNVPGPPIELYAFGVPMEQIFGFVPLGGSHPMNVGILSYNGTVRMTLVADPRHVPDLDVLHDGIIETLRELGELAADQRAAAEPAEDAAEEENAGFRAISAYLDQNAVDYRVEDHPRSEAAELVRVVVLRDDAAYRLVVLPAAEALDLKKVRRALNEGTVREPHLDELQRDFGTFERSSATTSSIRIPAPDVIDERVLECAEVSCVTDDRRHSIVLDPGFLVSLADARVRDICR
jgi:WS/DGAT/MGAT family acyltransferase